MADKKANDRAGNIGSHFAGHHGHVIQTSVNLIPEPSIVPNDRYRFRPQGSSWGDFGADDEKGRLNLVTPEKVRQGIAEVKEFKTFCLSLPLNLPGPTMLAGRDPPRLWPTGVSDDKPMFNQPMSSKYSDIVCDDKVMLTLQYSTQWDSLSHVGSIFDVSGTGKPVICYYNGYQADTHLVGPVSYAHDYSGTVLSRRDTHPGAGKLGVQNVAEHPVQGRAVLVDLEKHYGCSKQKFSWAQLKSVLDKDKIEVRKGDFVLFHTGCGRKIMEAKGKITKEEWAVTSCGLDGRDPDILKWITDSGVVALISDNLAVEASQNPPADRTSGKLYPSLGIHEHCLFKLGVYLGELWYLSDLADHLRSVGRSAFLLTAPPLRLPGAVGSPAQGVATV